MLAAPSISPATALSLAIPKPPTAGANADTASFDRAASEFEAFFLGQMIEYMFAGIETDGPFGGGPGEQAFRSLLNQEYGKAIAQAGGLGIAATVKQEMLKAQEGR